jgi:DNA-binding MarR family transcriptional regulator
MKKMACVCLFRMIAQIASRKRTLTTFDGDPDEEYGFIVAMSRVKDQGTTQAASSTSSSPMTASSSSSSSSASSASAGGGAAATEANLPTASDCAKMSLSCACYNLRRASRAVTQLFDAYFDEVGLKATQFTVLAALAYSEDKPPTIGELAETLVLEQSSLSRNLAVLERLGFIRLVPGEHDRRERIVTLTRAGQRSLAKGYPIWRKAQSSISKALEDNDFDAQLRSLRRLTKTAQTLRPTKSRSQSAS